MDGLQTSRLPVADRGERRGEGDPVLLNREKMSYAKGVKTTEGCSVGTPPDERVRKAEGV